MTIIWSGLISKIFICFLILHRYVKSWNFCRNSIVNIFQTLNIWLFSSIFKTIFFKITHLHETNSSSFNGKKTNCSALTAQNNSNSKERSCLTLQTHAPTLATDPNINGMNTRTHKCRLDVNLSHANNSNINRIKCKESDINIALKWLYESFSNR